MASRDSLVHFYWSTELIDTIIEYNTLINDRGFLLLFSDYGVALYCPKSRNIVGFVNFDSQIHLSTNSCHSSSSKSSEKIRDKTESL